MVCTEAFEQNKLDAMADAVLAYKPPEKAKATKRREKRRSKHAQKKDFALLVKGKEDEQEEVLTFTVETNAKRAYGPLGQWIENIGKAKASLTITYAEHERLKIGDVTATEEQRRPFWPKIETHTITEAIPKDFNRVNADSKRPVEISSDFQKGSVEIPPGPNYFNTYTGRFSTGVFNSVHPTGTSTWSSFPLFHKIKVTAVLNRVFSGVTTS